MVVVVLTKSAQKDIVRLPADVQADVNAKVIQLRDYPAVASIKALQGAMKGQLRVRVGNYRIVFTFAAGTITIVAVTDRKETY